MKAIFACAAVVLVFSGCDVKNPPERIKPPPSNREPAATLDLFRRPDCVLVAAKHEVSIETAQRIITEYQRHKTLSIEAIFLNPPQNGGEPTERTLARLAKQEDLSASRVAAIIIDYCALQPKSDF